MFGLTKINNNAGISMVQTLVAIAMSGGLALGLMQLGRQQSQIQTHTDSTFIMTDAMNQIERLMLDSVSCQMTLAQATGVQINEVTPLPSIKDDENNDVFTAGAELSPHLTLTNILLTRLPNEAASLRIEFQRTSKNAIGGRDIAKTINLSAIYDGAGNLESCSTAQDLAAAQNLQIMCEQMLLGTWNAETQTCENHRICQLEQQIMALTSTGGIDSCGNEWEVVTNQQPFGAGSHTFTFPAQAVPGSLSARIIGGGGGGASAENSKAACGGKAATEVEYSFSNAPLASNCTVTVGGKGQGGQRPGPNTSTSVPGTAGGTSMVNCNGDIASSTGGLGAVTTDVCSNNQNGKPGDSTSFNNSAQAGGAGGVYGGSYGGQDSGAIGSGGGGGAERKISSHGVGSGGDGGDGRVIIFWSQLSQI